MELIQTNQLQLNLPNTDKRGKKSPRVCTRDLFQGQLSSAYGGALFTFILLKYSSSPFVAPVRCPISTRPHSIFTGLE
jgi:hypothetical protein